MASVRELRTPDPFFSLKETNYPNSIKGEDKEGRPGAWFYEVSFIRSYKGSRCLSQHGRHWNASFYALLITDAGEGEEAQRHIVKAEIKMMTRETCMEIYKSSGYSHHNTEGSHSPSKLAPL